MKAPSGGTRSVVRITFPESAADSADDVPCTSEEFWLVAQNGAAVSERKRLAGGCAPDPPDGSWCGWPPKAEVRVDGEQATVAWRDPTMRCSSAFKSLGTETASLETFHSLRSEATTYRIVPPSESVTKVWDWRTFRGTLEWAVGNDSCPPVQRKPIRMIPRITVDDDFVSRDWQTLPMSDCSTAFVADPHKGSVLLRGLTLHAVIARGDVLFVDLEHDEQSATPLAGSLRVCTAELVPTFADYCTAKQKPDCMQIELPGRALKQTVERSAQRDRFKISLPPERGAVTVTFVAEHGAGSISSSSLSPLDSTALSAVFDIEPELASCRVANGKLGLMRNPSAL